MGALVRTGTRTLETLTHTAQAALSRFALTLFAKKLRDRRKRNDLRIRDRALRAGDTRLAPTEPAGETAKVLKHEAIRAFMPDGAC